MKVLHCNKTLIAAHIAEALVISGLPKSTMAGNITYEIADVDRALGWESISRDNPNIPNNYGKSQLEILKPHLDRAKKLGPAKAGSGHDCFLKGIVVTAVVSMPQYQWQQAKRYHFFDLSSSQSTMHRITEMDLYEQCNDEVDQDTIKKLEEAQEKYKYLEERVKALNLLRKDAFTGCDEIKELNAELHTLFRYIINNLPAGLQLASGIVTNYLQLKTMRSQRHPHELEEWHRDFVNWVDSLPYFLEFTGIKK